MKKNYRAYFLNWTTINEIGKIKLLRSSFIIFFLLPIIAQIIEKYKIDYAIPISWLLLYYSTLSISIGTILYAVFCPEIVSKYTSFEDFYKSGKGGPYLYNQLSKLVRKKHNNENELKIEVQKYSFAHLKNYLGSGSAVERCINTPTNEIFWFVHNSLNYSKTLVRICITLFYGIGFILLTYVFIEKICTVTKYLISIQ
jgi:predicted membrane channel-forming protein YqfA (hemolysin III family)